jgi:ferredoxin-thioredoxin reductase catalytic subunit
MPKTKSKSKLTEQSKSDINKEKRRLAEIFVRSLAAGVCAQYGYTLNPDLKFLDKICNSLAHNVLTYGKAYCPCRIIIQGNDNNDKVCPCRESATEIAARGHCRCRLFFGKTENKEEKHG